jgi:hypothetical protein
MNCYSSSLMKQETYYGHTRKPNKSFKKYLVLFEQFFHSMVVNSSRNGKYIYKYCLSIEYHKIYYSIYLTFRYEKELHPTRWSNIRQGTVYGLFVGWMSLTTYIVYSVGFIFGSLLMADEDHKKLNISDILVVSDFCH